MSTTQPQAASTLPEPPPDWEADYRARTTTAAEAIRAAVRSGDRIFMTGNCSVPERLLAALVEHAPHLRGVEICHPLTVTDVDYTHPTLEGHLRVNSLFISGNVRQAVQAGRADFTPVLLSELPLLFTRGALPLDVAFVHLSPPDARGYCTFGIESGLTKSTAEAARVIVAEVNPNMPRTLGDTLIHASRLDYVVPVDDPLAELPMAHEARSEVVEKIAGFIAERIPDGATLQLGIGAIPDAVLPYLYHKKDLGLHSELFSDGVMALAEAGVLTGARKTLHPGKIIAGFLLGSRALYRWVDGNPLVELHPTEYVNDPFVIRQNERMVAINSALEVDLTGQVCADSLGTRLYSGTGGQMDFIYGASRSKGGVPVIALPSTTALRSGERISRIVPTLRPGAGVVTTRSHVHWVATEYGMVDLYGKSVRQRALLLISIAHPEFRADLQRAAAELSYL